MIQYRILSYDAISFYKIKYSHYHVVSYDAISCKSVFLCSHDPEARLYISDVIFVVFVE